ncbi:hypothetical protein MKW98_031488 [Papaver atlanticum]|uniref:Uncharacterized protein n=1 Tax=Papaver atlanticum TaxID=357466 RepID=A0AAD4S6P2_9MAGN|nr:hypothetical protein MKW98_031488 [Papaver atlanticum]
MEAGEVDVENNNEDDASDGVVVEVMKRITSWVRSNLPLNKEGLGNGIESAVIDRDSQGELKWTWWYKRCYVRYRECLCYDAEKNQAATVNSNKDLKMVILRMGLLEEIGNDGGVTLHASNIFDLKRGKSMNTSRSLYVRKKKKGQFPHSSFLSGGATTAAGRLVAHDGVLEAIWPYSGHYLPTEENFK